MKKNLLKVLIWLCGLLLIGGPVAIVLMGNIDGIMTQRFLVIDWEGAAIHACFTLLFLLPAIILGVWLLVEHRRGKLREWIRALLLVGYLLSAFGSFLGLLGMAFSSPYCSQTEDIAHYMQLDDYTNVEEAFVRDFFPAQPGTEDAVYRYHAEYSTLDYELYARWTLPKEALDAEIARVQAVFDRYGKACATEQRGGFTCLLSCYHESDPYSCMSLFAYHPETGEVRYYDCDNLHGEAHPLFLADAW